MKIVFLIRSLNRGGAEGQIITLGQGLCKEGHCVSIFTFYPGGSLEKELQGEAVKIVSFQKKGRWEIFPFLFRLLRALRREKPDILYSFLVESNIIAVILKPLLSKTKIVWGIRASNVDLARYDWFVRLTFRLQCILSRFADLIIANSKAGADYHIAKSFPKDKVKIIPNGIDTERFSPSPEARKRIRLEWGIREDERLIGLIGRLDPMKDHATFLRAASLLQKERDNVRFVCVGRDTTDYKQELQELGLTKQLIWIGERSDMPAVYNALDILCSSSFGEGLSNVVIEAMSCGVPAVVTDVGDSADIVGDTGIVVPPKEPEALANGLKLMLERLRDDSLLSEKTRSRISSQFSQEILVQKTSEVLTSLLTN
ncbi:MAG: glycosyltransferase [bacterium]|nr:glycosyltransferase [bacterium]